jgi:hypothetical protein
VSMSKGRRRQPPQNMEVVDAFCGAGGFSAGAMVAGCRVTMGIDSDPTPLKLWAANTGGRAVCATIGRDVVDWPEARPGLHVHLSPVCILRRRRCAMILLNIAVRCIRIASPPLRMPQRPPPRLPAARRSSPPSRPAPLFL